MADEYGDVLTSITTTEQSNPFEGKLPNDDVQDTADFIDRSGLNKFPEMFAAFPRDNGYSLGFTDSALEKMQLTDVNSEQPVYLRVLSQGEGVWGQRMIAYQEEDRGGMKVHRGLGLIVDSGTYVPFKQGIVFDADQTGYNFDLFKDENFEGGSLELGTIFSLSGGLSEIKQEVVELDSATPDVNEAQYLLCMVARERIKHSWDDQDSLNRQLPWPDSSSLDPDQIEKWERLDDGNRYSKVKAAFQRMEVEDRAEIARVLVDNWHIMTSTDLSEAVGMYQLVFDGVDVKHGDAGLVGEQAFRLLAMVDFNDSDAVIDGFDALDVIDHIGRDNQQTLIYQAIAQGRVDIDSTNRVVGYLMSELGIAGELNVMRGLLDQDYLEPGELQQVEGLVRRVLGLWGVEVDENVPVHTALNHLYESVKFEEYKVSLETANPRLEMLTMLFEKLGIDKDANILDLGSGTGWMTAGLRNRDFKNTYGMDDSDRNVQVASEKYGEVFAKGDWYKLAQEIRDSDVIPNNLKAIVSLGRSLPHTEDEKHFLQVIDQAYETLDEGGWFIFDMPDPELGSYWENVSSYRKVLEGFEFSPEEIEDVWMVVDSPDGENFYNRYTPPIKLIEEFLNRKGFELVALNMPGEIEGHQGVIREELPNEKGDSNIVYVCRKTEPPSRQIDLEQWELT